MPTQYEIALLVISFYRRVWEIGEHRVKQRLSLVLHMLFITLSCDALIFPPSFLALSSLSKE